MKDFVTKKGNTSHVMDSKPKMSAQRPINEILQTYRDRASGRFLLEKKSIEYKDISLYKPFVQKKYDTTQFVGWESLGIINPRRYLPTFLGGYTSQEMGKIRKTAVANNAINYSKGLMTHGPQNQQWARDQYGDEGDVNMAAMIELINKSIFKGVQGNYNNDWTRPRRIGAAVAATGGGNCQDIAALTYNYLREQSELNWTICYVVNPDIHHAFATIGTPSSDNPNEVIVADAWVRYPKAMPLSNHFCKNGPFNVLKSNGGAKANRLNSLQSKYWDVNQLPQYVRDLKNRIRTFSTRNPATWNHEYPDYRRP